MKDILRIMLFSLLIGAAAAPLAISQEATETMEMEISGTVESVDMENSLLVVKQLVSAEEGIYENATISISDATSIEKNYIAATLSDVAAGDKVTVKYIVDEEGKMVASYIVVESAE